MLLECIHTKLILYGIQYFPSWDGNKNKIAIDKYVNHIKINHDDNKTFIIWNLNYLFGLTHWN